MHKFSLKFIFPILLAFSFILASLFAVSSVTFADGEDASAGADSFVGRIYYDDMADIEALIELNVDLHEYNNLEEGYVLAGMTEESFAAVQAAGYVAGPDDVATGAHNSFLEQPYVPGTYYGGYRTVQEMYTILNTTNAANPTITELIDYGDSWCKQNAGSCNLAGAYNGVDLRAIRIANEANAAAPIGTRPAFFLVAAVHSRELTTSEQALFYIDYLVSNYGTDPDVTWILDWHEVYIVPVANPDGRYAVETINGGTPVSQRKNANNTNGACGNAWGNSGSQPGIDLNRNSTYAWNTGGSSGNPCNLTYRGSSAGSEPEVSQLQAYVQSIIPDQRGAGNAVAPQTTEGLFISMHAYSDLILWPWGNTTGPAPNITGLRRIGDKLGAMTGYTSCQPSICLYSASGTTDDWSYGELGVPSFTYEIGSSGDGFFANYTTASTTHWNEVRESLEYSARIAHYPYKVAEGPDADNVTVTPLGGNLFDVTATLRENQNGNQQNQAAVFLVDTPPWVTGAISNTMTATDGNFNSNVEAIEGMFDSCQLGLSQGQHMLWVRGQDANGNWGPPWAQWFNVTSNCVPTAVSGLNGTINGVGNVTPLLIAVIFTLLGLLSLTLAKRNIPQ